MTNRRNIFTLPLLLIACCVSFSCSRDEYPGDGDAATASFPSMSVSVGVSGATRAGSPSDYEAGEGLENYLDVTSDNYRLYFFTADAENDEDNTYIGSFRPYSRQALSSETVDGVSYFYYKFDGEIPADLPLKFKLVTLANWNNYPVETAPANATEGGYQLVKGVTRIQDICTHVSSQFSYITPSDGVWLENPGRLIPFYGVREYDMHDYVKEADIADGKIKSDLYVSLEKTKNGSATPLPLLRAMAKVEVVLDNPFSDFERVTIHNVNAKGYCAPEAALRHTDYDHGYQWDLDFVRGVHLPGGVNNPAIPEELEMTKVTAEGLLTKKWVAYVPEYRNIGIDAYSYITVRLAKPAGMTDEEWEKAVSSLEDGELEKKIYFASGCNAVSNETDNQAVRKPDGTFTNGRFNIERNNIYRFTIEGMTGKMTASIDVQPYSEQKIDYKLGLMRDEAGDLIINEESQFWDEIMAVFHGFPLFIPVTGKYNENGVYEKGIYDIYGDFKASSYAPRLVYRGDIGDYYAIVLPPNGNIRESEIWIKDSDGCRVLSNFNSNVMDEEENDMENDPGCSARLVRDFSTLTPADYFKDSEGFQRLQHNQDHSTIVVTHTKEMLLKTVVPDDESVADATTGQKYKTDKCYLVESWNDYVPATGTTPASGGDYWYRINIHYNQDDPEMVDITFRKGDIKRWNYPEKTYEDGTGTTLAKDVVVTVKVSELSERDRQDLPTHPIEL